MERTSTFIKVWFWSRKDPAVPADVKTAGKAAVEALKAATTLQGEELQKAIAKAKFAAASAYDGREGIVSALGSKVSSLSSRHVPAGSFVSGCEGPLWLVCICCRRRRLVRQGRCFCILEGRLLYFTCFRNFTHRVL